MERRNVIELILPITIIVYKTVLENICVLKKPCIFITFSRNLCGEFDASLTVIDSPEIQTEANDFAKLEKTDFWTGISNDNSVYFTRNYYSSEHLELNITNFYWHKLQRSRRWNYYNGGYLRLLLSTLYL